MNHAGRQVANGTTVQVATGAILELAVPFARLDLNPGDPIRFYVELYQGDSSLDRAPARGDLRAGGAVAGFRADHVASLNEEVPAMPELRKDPIVGRWVIIAHERAKRPHDFKSEEPAPDPAMVCPFCEGHEDKTPPEILAYRDFGSRPNGPGWRVRVVPNRFPALKIEGSLNKRGDGIYDVMEGIGAHEVIIESASHHKSMATLAPDTIREVIWVYRDRLVDLKRDRRLVHGMLFKNVGAAGGASLEHTHSQLIVTPIVPISVWEEMTGSLEFYQLSRPVHLLRHGPARAGGRKTDRCRFTPLHGVLSVRQPLSLRNLDRAQDALQPF